MNKLLVLTLALTLPLAQIVRANDDTDKKKKRKHQAEVAEEQRSQPAAQSQQKAAGRPAKRPAPPVRPGTGRTQHTAAKSPHSAVPVPRQSVKSEADLNRTESRAHASVEQGQESESAC